MAHAHDQDDELLVDDLVDDPVIADAQQPGKWFDGLRGVLAQ
jgi:hypothetical protein